MKHPERNYGNIHCLLSQATTNDVNQRELCVEVITVFLPVYQSKKLDKLKCQLDEDGGGFTVT